MWELDHKENWAPRNWCFWTVVLEKTLEGPLDYKEIKPVNPKGNQRWRFIGKTEGRRRRGPQRMRWLDGITNLMDMNLMNMQSMGLQRVGHDWATEQQLTSLVTAEIKLGRRKIKFPPDQSDYSLRNRDRTGSADTTDWTRFDMGVSPLGHS